MATDGGDAGQNVCQPFMNTNTVIHGEIRSLGKGRCRGVYGRKSTSQESPRGTHASKLTNSTPVAVVQPNMVSLDIPTSHLVVIMYFTRALFHLSGHKRKGGCMVNIYHK